jgi:hypothetical protein
MLNAINTKILLAILAALTAIGATLAYQQRETEKAAAAVECPALFVPVEMRQTGTEGAFGWHVERSILRSRL